MRSMGMQAMLFDEVYGSTYHIVAALLREALKGGLSLARLKELTARDGAGKGAVIRGALENGAWPLLLPDGTPAVESVPGLAPTTLELRWLKSICQDPRVRLFLPEGLEEDPDLAAAEPLFSPEFLVHYDRYDNGDPFEDPDYIRHIRLIVQALREKKALVIVYQNKKGTFSKKFYPHSLEYSPKDDKFRLLARNAHGLPYTLNASNIKNVIPQNEPCPADMAPPRSEKKSLLLELVDERDALERASLHFSDLEKETFRQDESHYRITLRYYESDEAEILIRVLAFGPLLKVIGPDAFITLIRECLAKQKMFGNK